MYSSSVSMAKPWSGGGASARNRQADDISTVASCLLVGGTATTSLRIAGSTASACLGLSNLVR